MKQSRDDTAQMLVWEATVFAGIVLLSLFFVYQFSPSSTVSSSTSSNELKIIGDHVLQSLSDNVLTGNYPPLYPSSTLVHYLITNNIGSMISDLNNMLPANVMYNIYINNGTKRVFWCNSIGSSTALPSIEPVSVSHYIVAISSEHLTDYPDEMYVGGSGSWLAEPTFFQGYDDSLYDVILEMWYI